MLQVPVGLDQELSMPKVGLAPGTPGLGTAGHVWGHQGGAWLLWGCLGQYSPVWAQRGDDLAPNGDAQGWHGHMQGCAGVVWPCKGMYGDSMALYRDSVAPYSVVWSHTGTHRGDLSPYGDVQGLYGPI